MQHFDKVEILGFMQSKVVERLTTIGFVMLFRFFGDMNPAYGILMGLLIGNVIGTYVDDIAFEFLSAYYLNKNLKKYFGLSLRDAFRVKYDREVLHDIWVYGLKAPSSRSSTNSLICMLYSSMWGTSPLTRRGRDSLRRA